MKEIFILFLVSFFYFGTSYTVPDPVGTIPKFFLEEENRGDFNRIKLGDGTEKIITRNGEPTEIVEKEDEIILNYLDLGRGYQVMPDGTILLEEGIDISFFINNGKYADFPHGVYKIAVYSGDNQNFDTKDKLVKMAKEPKYKKLQEDGYTFYYTVMEQENWLVYFRLDSNDMVIEYGISIYEAENLE